jgi:hypothetical protein
MAIYRNYKHMSREKVFNMRWQTEESEDEDASLTSKKPRYDHDFILMNV